MKLKPSTKRKSKMDKIGQPKPKETSGRMVCHGSQPLAGGMTAFAVEDNGQWVVVRTHDGNWRIGVTSLEMPRGPDVVGAEIEEYLEAQKARLPLIGAMTMRPMSEAPINGKPILAVSNEVIAIVSWTCGEWCVAVRLDDFGNVETVGFSDPDGWWPLPDMSPMPAKFEGWTL